MGILSVITGDTVPFCWTHKEHCTFEEVKHLVHKARKHHRVPLDYSLNAPPIWIITNGCKTGVAGAIAQGKDWKTAKITTFYSAKLNPTQCNYPVHEIKILAGVETMLRHRDILQGAKFTWVTDHKGLTYLLKPTPQEDLIGCRACWMEKIGIFDFDILYVEGKTNVFADTLSCMYSNDTPGTVRAHSEFTYHDVVNKDAPVMTEAPAPIFTGLEAAAISPLPAGCQKKDTVPLAETGRAETGTEFVARMARHFVLKGPRERREGEGQDKETTNAPEKLFIWI
jgi:RNase H-like domain found in reverse transcriptase